MATSAMLVAGCRSGAPARQPASPAAAQAAPAREPARDWPAEKVAQAHAHYGAGVIHEMNDETAAAVQEYYLAALDDPDNESLQLEVSRRLLQTKQPEKALEILKQAAARPKASGEVLARLSLVYSALGQRDDAIVTARAAIKRAPDSLPGYQNLFLTYLQAKQEPEALKVLDQAAKQPGTNAEFLLGLSELYGSYAIQLPAQKEMAKSHSLALLNRAEKLDLSSPLTRARLADGFDSVGAYEKAARLYLDLLKRLPDVPLLRERIHAKLADIYLHSSNHQRAAEQLEALVRDDPTNPQAYYFLGALCYEDNKPEVASDYFRKALLLKPEFEQAYYDLALAQISLNKTNEALSTLGEARKKFPANFLLEFWTGLAYSRAREYPQAVAHFTAAEIQARAKEPQRLTQAFYFQFGAACERTGDLAQAEKYFQTCLRFAPEDAETLNYLGYMWAEHGLKLEQARELIEKALKIEPKNPAFLDSFAWVLFKLNQPQQALTQVLKAIELSKEPDATVYEHLGDIYAALGQKEKAREAWTRSLALEPNEGVRKKLESADARRD